MATYFNGECQHINLNHIATNWPDSSLTGSTNILKHNQADGQIILTQIIPKCNQVVSIESQIIPQYS